MEVGQALSQISEIHERLAKAEVYRGLRPVPVALTGLVALAAAAVQAQMSSARQGPDFVLFWLAVAAVSAIGCGADIAASYLRHEDAFGRRRTRTVLGQFAPCLVAGAAVTAGFLGEAADAARLPGIWAMLFGLGLVSTRPYLPRAMTGVSLFYVLAGAVLLLVPGLGGSPWGMGAVFGAGQLATALVLCDSPARRESHEG